MKPHSVWDHLDIDQGHSLLAIPLAVPLLSPLVALLKYLTSLRWLEAPDATVDMSYQASIGRQEF